MTATSLGTAASVGGGGGGPRCTLLASFKKRKIKTIKNRRLTGSCADDARNQEEAGNSERSSGSLQEPKVVVLAALAPPIPLKVQEPVNRRRGHDFNGEVIWASKKQRSSNAAAREIGNAIAEAAAAATSSPIVQELAGNREGGNPICNKGHVLPLGSVGVAMYEKTEEKLSSLPYWPPLPMALMICAKTGRLLSWTLHCHLKVFRNLWRVITTTMGRRHAG
ncbi:unnamed protein product [Urochloa humidicola]